MKGLIMSKIDNVDIWLPVYIGEMLAIITRFNTEQIGALHLLMMDYWKNGEPPYDYKIIAAITGLSTTKSRVFIKLLLSIKLFEINGEILFSSYLDEKKEIATNNRKIKAERAKKGSDARWGKTASNDSGINKSKSNQSNVKAIPTTCLSNAKDMHKQCPSPSPSSKTSLSHSVGQIDTLPIKDWIAPSLDSINQMIRKASTNSPVLSSTDYEQQVIKFKNYYTEQELKNNPILTEERRCDVLIAWINNDRQYQLKHKISKGEHYESASKANQGNASGNAFDHAANYVEQGQQDVDTYFDGIA